MGHSFWRYRSWTKLVKSQDHQTDYRSFQGVHELLSSSCWDDSLDTTNVNLMVAREEKSGDHFIHYGPSSGDRECDILPSTEP